MKRKIIITAIIVLIFCICSQVFALDGLGIKPSAGITSQGVKSVAGKIIGTMQWAGYAIAVIVMVYIGIKFVTSSADERASFKSVAWKYVLGAVLITSAVTLVNWIYN